MRSNLAISHPLRRSLGLRGAGLLTLLTLTLGAGPAAATVQHPNVERGFQAEKAYEIGDIDHINAFNGNLIATLPIGGTYSAGGNLSYGLTLVYNGKAWDWQQLTVLGDAPAPQAIPSVDSNVGLGWQLHLGRLWRPQTPRNPGHHWLYLAQDGGEHVFYDTLHEGEPAVAGVRYSRNGSYLRLKDEGDTVTPRAPVSCRAG